jgi:Flp pilus assembly protein TadG
MLIRRGGARPEHGASAVEFALVMIPLITLLFGAIQYGLYFWAMQGGSDITRSAVRASAVGDANVVTCAGFRANIRSQIGGLGDGATATITRTFTKANASGVRPGDKVQVSVQFKSTDMHLPFIPFIRDGLVTSTAESRVDYVDEQNPPQDCS